MNSVAGIVTIVDMPRHNVDIFGIPLVSGWGPPDLGELEKLGAAIEMGPLDMQEWICDGNNVAVRGEEGSLVHATQKRYHMRFVHWLTVNDDGRITNMREFNDTAAMGEAF